MTEKIRLAVVACSTRPGRHGGTIARWAAATVNLPLLDEPHHPRLANYTKDHTKRWSAMVAATDAFVWVTPEYDYAMPASLRNALQCLSNEWKYKACSFVSYGGVSAGLRGVQMSKQVVTALGMMPIQEAVALPSFTAHIKDGVFAPGETQDKAAVAMLDGLAKWSTALAPMRAE